MSSPAKKVAIRHARMLVAKLSYRDGDRIAIHWPKDQYEVVYAATEDELIEKLANWLVKLGRTGNLGLHVIPGDTDQNR